MSDLYLEIAKQPDEVLQAIEELESKVSGLKYDSLMNQITRMNDGELESLAEKTKAVRRCLKFPTQMIIVLHSFRLNVTMTG